MMGDFNDGVEAAAQYVETMAGRMRSRSEASAANGFITALTVVAGEMRGLKTRGSAASIGTTMSLARLDIRAADAPDEALVDDDYYRDRVHQPV